MPDRVRELRPPRGLEERQQVEPTGVVGAVAHTAEGGYATGVPTAAKRLWDEVSGVYTVHCTQTMQGRPATAARCLSVAASDAVSCSGVVRRSGFRARSDARRRSGVRFIVVPFDRVTCEVRSGSCHLV